MSTPPPAGEGVAGGAAGGQTNTRFASFPITIGAQYYCLYRGVVVVVDTEKSMDKKKCMEHVAMM